jgi:hypothetical protein
LIDLSAINIDLSDNVYDIGGFFSEYNESFYSFTKGDEQVLEMPNAEDRLIKQVLI